MSISANIHQIVNMEAQTRSGVHWLKVTTKNGSHIALHMEERFCDAIADAWAEQDSWEPEPPTFDEALATKCAAMAREDEARRMK